MSRRPLREAAVVLVALGTGHLVVVSVADRRQLGRWVREGLWASVPLDPRGERDRLARTHAFWSGFASFGVPLTALGGLVWHLDRRDVAVPEWLGWTIVGWAGLGGVMLVPSPFFLGMLPGYLVVRAARTRSGRGPLGIRTRSRARSSTTAPPAR